MTQALSVGVLVLEVTRGKRLSLVSPARGLSSITPDRNPCGTGLKHLTNPMWGLNLPDTLQPRSSRASPRPFPPRPPHDVRGLCLGKTDRLRSPAPHTHRTAPPRPPSRLRLRTPPMTFQARSCSSLSHAQLRANGGFPAPLPRGQRLRLRRSSPSPPVAFSAGGRGGENCHLPRIPLVAGRARAGARASPCPPPPPLPGRSFRLRQRRRGVVRHPPPPPPPQPRPALAAAARGGGLPPAGKEPRP